MNNEIHYEIVKQTDKFISIRFSYNYNVVVKCFHFLEMKKDIALMYYDTPKSFWDKELPIK